MDEFWHEDDYSWIEFGTLRSNASTLFPRRSLRIDALPEPKNVFVGGNFKLEKYISSFKFSILENEMDEDEEFFFFLFSRVNSFDGAKVYIYISRSKIEWVGRKSRRSAIRILVRIDLRDDRGTISRANRSRSDPAARNVEGIEADERSEKAVHDPEDPGSRDRHPTETSGQKLSKISADKKTAGFL